MKFDGKTNDELKTLLDNYEHRMLDSAIQTAQAMREIHEEILLRERLACHGMSLTLMGALRLMAKAIRHNVTHRADFTSSLTGFVEGFARHHGMTISTAWTHSTVQALATEIFETR